MKISSADLAPYAPFIAKLHAPKQVRLTLSIDTDDVRSECLLAVAIAIAKFRSSRPGRVEDERCYAYMAAHNKFRDIERRARNSRNRARDDASIAALASAYSPSHAQRERDPLGYGWIEFAVTSPAPPPDPEEVALNAANQNYYATAVTHLRGALGQARFDVIQKEHTERLSNAEYHRRTRSYKKAKRILNQDLEFSTLETRLKERKPKMPFSAEHLKDTEHLARVALINDYELTDYSRAYLVGVVDEINDGVDFPTCFATGKDGEQEVEFDDADDDCRDCGFFAECGACVGGKWTRPDIEERLVRLKSAHGAETAEPAAPARPERTPKPVGPRSAAPASPPPATKPPPRKAKAKTKKPPPKKKAKPLKPRISPPKNPKNAPLSERKGVLPPGQDTFKGTHFRLPQGSAVASAALPVGTEASRLWPVNGNERRYYYTIEKIEMGIAVRTEKDTKRRRGGVWKVVAVYQGRHVTKNEFGIWTLAADATPLKRHPLLGSEGSLNSIAFEITGGRNWSGARLFGLTADAAAVLVPALKLTLARSSASMYVYR